MKLSPKELRPGNLVQWSKNTNNSGMVEKIDAVNHTIWDVGDVKHGKMWWVETENCEGELLKNFEPIKLTEEVLSQLKFKKIIGHHFNYYFLRHGVTEYKISTYDKGYVLLQDNKKVRTIEYAHQLQNLMYDLCGIEI